MISKGVLMQKRAGRKAYLLVNGIVHLAFILIMMILVSSLPGNGSELIHSGQGALLF
jgi:uncharacterized membrane protein YhaH (DUF805 family)